MISATNRTDHREAKSARAKFQAGWSETWLLPSFARSSVAYSRSRQVRFGGGEQAAQDIPRRSHCGKTTMRLRSAVLCLCFTRFFSVLFYYTLLSYLMCWTRKTNLLTAVARLSYPVRLFASVALVLMVVANYGTASSWRFHNE